MHSQRSMGTQCLDWQGTAGEVTVVTEGSFLIWQVPWELGGTDNHYGNLISPWPPSPTLVREKLAEVKWEYWRLSRDDNFHFKVDGIKLFPFHVATGERWGEVTLLFLSAFSEG